MSNKLKFKEKFGYTLTAMASDFTTQFTGSFLLYFYTNVAGIKAGLASTIISLSVIWDAINDPLIASYVDNHSFKNGERMRPVLLWSSFPFAICLVMLFTMPEMSYGAKVFYALFWYLLYMVPRTFYYLPVFTLRQLATDDTGERLSINSYISIGQAFGSSMPTLIMWPIIRMIAGVDANKNMINPKSGFVSGALVVAAIVIICSIYNYATTKERVKAQNEEKTKIVDAFKIVFKNNNFIINLILFFFYGMCVTLFASYAVYYCTYVLCNPNMVTPLSAAYIVGTILTTPFVKKLYEKVGRNKALIIGSVILVAGAALFVALPRVLIVPFLFTFAVGVGTTITIIIIGINRADITDVIEFQSGRRMDAMVSNVTNFVKKCAHAVIVFILGWVLQFSGYDGSLAVQPKSALVAIVMIMGAGTLISAAFMALSSSKLTLDEEVTEAQMSKGELK